MTSMVTALLGAVLIGLITEEVLSWSTKLSQAIVRWNAKRLPAEISPRYEEEWLAHADDLPGRLSKIVFAIGTLGAVALISHEHYRPNVPYRVALGLRALDVVFASAALLFQAPVLVALALALFLSGRFRGVISASTRVGQRGRVFRYYTFNVGMPFREAKEPGFVKNLSWVLRTFSASSGMYLLPSLYNLLRGDLTLVGPPPLRQLELDQLAKILPEVHRQLLTLRPGMISYGHLITNESLRRATLKVTPRVRRLAALTTETELLTQPELSGELGVRFVLRVLRYTAREVFRVPRNGGRKPNP